MSLIKRILVQKEFISKRMLYFFQILEKILPTFFFFNKNGVYEKKTHFILTFIDDKV